MKTLSLSALFVSLIGLTACNEESHPKPMLIGEWTESIPDMADMNQGFKLEENGKASSVNMSTLVYEKWKQKDSLLILNGKSIGNELTCDFSDTLTIKKITTDSLIVQRKTSLLKYKKNLKKE